MDSRNGWERDTAQRLLLERRDRSVLPMLEAMAVDARQPEGRVLALRTAQRLGEVTMPTVLKAARDPHPRVREHAAAVIGMELAEARAEIVAGREMARPSPRPFWEALFQLARDPDARVQLAATLARAGFVVAQPLHQGDNHQDTTLAGPDSWQRRPAEITRTLDALEIGRAHV